MIGGGKQGSEDEDEEDEEEEEEEEEEQQQQPQQQAASGQEVPAPVGEASLREQGTQQQQAVGAACASWCLTKPFKPGRAMRTG